MSFLGFIYRQIVRLVISISDFSLALIYLIAWILQESSLYKKIGIDRLIITKRIVARLSSFFDAKALYSFYERQFYVSFVQSMRQPTEIAADARKKFQKFQRSHYLDTFNKIWQTQKSQKLLNTWHYTLLNSIFIQLPEKIFLFNTPDELDMLVETANKVVTTENLVEIQVVNLNLFRSSSEVSTAISECVPLRERYVEILSQFKQGDYFLFGLDDPVPPLDHIKEVFTEILPRLPENMRVGVYGVSGSDEEDEWIKWNLSFWSAETLLEVLIKNSEKFSIEWDSRFLDFSEEECSVSRFNKKDPPGTKNLIVLKSLKN